MFGLGIGELTLIFLIFLVTPAQNLTEQDDKSNPGKFT
jgi:hypothetical protein